MSLTAAIHGAMSGLKAASRGTQIVSENISNATNPDYARRSLALGASAIAGPGVRVLGVEYFGDWRMVLRILSGASGFIVW